MFLYEYLMKVLTKERALFRHLRRHCSSSRCSREQVFHAQTTGRDLCEYLMKMRKKDSHSTRCCRQSSSREVLHGGVLVHGMAVSLVAAAQRSVGTLCLNTLVCGFGLRCLRRERFSADFKNKSALSFTGLAGRQFATAGV